jgi:hypothetical protein
MTAAVDMGLFMTWLTYTPANGGQVVLGPGAKPVRGEVRINRVLVAVRMFLSFAVVNKEAPSWVLGMIYGLADNRDLPLEAQSEDGGLFHRLRVRHRVQEPDSSVPGDRRGDRRAVRGLPVCLGPADRAVACASRAAPQRSAPVAGQPLHGFAPSKARHIHVVHRENVIGAWAKSRHTRRVPVDFLLVLAIDQYLLERQDCPAATASDYVLSGCPDNTTSTTTRTGAGSSARSSTAVPGLTPKARSRCSTTPPHGCGAIGCYCPG